jgi:hypothetical protein
MEDPQNLETEAYLGFSSNDGVRAIRIFRPGSGEQSDISPHEFGFADFLQGNDH